MKYDLKDYYYHTISKDNVDDTYLVFESVLKDKKLKSQQLLGKSETKFNGSNYVSIASYPEYSEYKSFIIEENDFNKSKLSNLFDNYNSYLDYMKLDNELEIPLSKEDFFKKNNTYDKMKYYDYLDSISRTYPVDIAYLYNKTKDKIYKYILEMIDDNILYCYKSDNCFDLYIRNSKGITFVFHKSIEVENVNIIPNLPSDLELKLVNKISDLSDRYSNLIGELQVKDYIDINKSIGIIVSDEIDLNKVKDLLKNNSLNIKLFKIEDNYLIERSN